MGQELCALHACGIGVLVQCRLQDDWKLSYTARHEQMYAQEHMNVAVHTQEIVRSGMVQLPVSKANERRYASCDDVSYLLCLCAWSADHAG